MTRRMEAIMGKVLYGVALVCAAAAVALCVHVFNLPSDALNVLAQEQEPPAAKMPASAELPADPALAKLAAARFSKTIAPKAPVVVVKPPAPALGSLIRVKGIMDFGDPKTNEAIIEIIRDHSTRNFVAGTQVEGVGAAVLKVDSAVVFQYDGKEISMGVNSDVSIELPVAGQFELPSIATGKPALKEP